MIAFLISLSFSFTTAVFFFSFHLVFLVLIFLSFVVVVIDEGSGNKNVCFTVVIISYFTGIIFYVCVREFLFPLVILTSLFLFIKFNKERHMIISMGL